MQDELVLVADGDTGFRAAVTAMLRRAGLVALSATTGDEVVEQARAQRPSVVVIDVGLREPSGFETCRILRSLYGETLPILFVSAERTEPYDRVAGLMVGGDDYITKPADLDELLARIVRASRRAHADRLEGGAPLAIPSVGTPSLTRRELEILGMVAHGQSPHEIASRLVISPKTVASHVQRVLGKLGVHSRTQAVARAYELGLVERRGR